MDTLQALAKVLDCDPVWLAGDETQDAAAPIAAGALTAARIAKGFASATDAAKAFGWNENTYRSHENGQRGLRPRQAKVYAEAFGIEPASLLFGGDEAPNAIAAARKAAGISQRDLAATLGMHWVTLSKVERGVIKLRWEQMVQIGEALGVEPASLAHAPNKIAERIISLRFKLGLSQVEFAERVGATQSAVSKWEKGLQKPGVDTAVVLAREAGTSVEEFVVG